MDVLEDFYKLHKVIFMYAIDSNNKISQKVSNKNMLSGGAIHKLTSISLCLHRGIECLCRNGWARLAPSLLRPMLDILINILTIVNVEDSDYMAFRYYAFDYLKSSKVIGKNSIVESNKQQIKRMLNGLEGKTKERAKEWLDNGKLERYWYSPEYSGPKAVLGRYTTKEFDIVFSYDRFSGFIHGGHIDSMFFQDNPDEISVNSNYDDVRSPMMALSGSSRFLLEISRSRNIFENIFREEDYNSILRKMVVLKPELDKLIVKND